ncbi:MATE family efflux transporter, partial [Intestinimonas butyriciproducens]
PLFTFLLAVSDIFGLGGSSVISRLFGEKNYELGRKISSFSMYGGIVTGLILTVILLLFEKPILTMLGARAATYG